MKMEKLKKDNRKKIIIGVVIAILLFMGVIGFVGTKAKYKYTAEYPIVSGTIHYKSGDLSVVAVNIENDSGEFTESESIPSEGYVLNRDKSYCGISNGDGTYTNENVTLIYNDGSMTFSNITKKGTKCFLYFNKPNYLVVSKTEDAANDVLGKEIARSSFESITTVASKNVPANAIDSWDASVRQNGSIMAWYTDTNNNGLYELFIGQDGGVIANPNSSWLFAFYTNVTNVDLGNIDTSKVTTMACMFNQISSLTSLDLSSFNTSKVTDMTSMFNEMTSLTELNISSFNTSKVTSMLAMFRKLESLVNLDLSHFNTTNVTTMESMFGHMTSIRNLNLSSFDTANVIGMTWMLCNTPTLQTLNLNKAVFDNVTQYDAMFWDSSVSAITVKDVSAQNFINARLSEVGRSATVTIA